MFQETENLEQRRKCTQVKRKLEFSYKGSAVAMQKSSSEEWRLLYWDGSNCV